MNLHKISFAAVVLLCFLPGLALEAQSDPAGFKNVINIPPTILGNDSTIGSSTQLNVFGGGQVGNSLTAGNALSTNVEVNLFGGRIGQHFNANRNTTVNIRGGKIDSFFSANRGSTVNLMSGRIRNSAFATDGSIVNIPPVQWIDSLRDREVESM